MKVMKIKFIFFLVFYCAIAYNQDIKVYRLGDAQLKSAENVYFYSLPRTSIILKVITKRITTIPGPYFAYAEEYMGIRGVPSENSVEWEIDSIGISTENEADPECWYALKADKPINPEIFLNFSSEGFIFSPPSQGMFLSPEILIPKPETHNPPYFTDLTKTNFFYNTADTFYKTILKDSLFIRVPIIKPKSEARPIKEKSREAADIIMKIRQWRFDTVLPDDGSLPEAGSFKIALAESYRIEQNYLALFIGKKFIDKFITWFVYTPTGNTKETQFEVFRFSPKIGIADKTIPFASPVYLTFDEAGNTKNLGEWMNAINAPKENHIFYRIPDEAVVYVNWKGDILASKQILVSQFGTIVSFPIKNIEKNKK
jgi:hypothetical protein